MSKKSKNRPSEKDLSDEESLPKRIIITDPHPEKDTITECIRQLVEDGLLTAEGDIDGDDARLNITPMGESILRHRPDKQKPS